MYYIVHVGMCKSTKTETLAKTGYPYVMEVYEHSHTSQILLPQASRPVHLSGDDTTDFASWQAPTISEERQKWEISHLQPPVHPICK